jgi:hypothetical protein
MASSFVRTNRERAPSPEECVPAKLIDESVPVLDAENISSEVLHFLNETFHTLTAKVQHVFSLDQLADMKRVQEHVKKLIVAKEHQQNEFFHIAVMLWERASVQCSDESLIYIFKKWSQFVSVYLVCTKTYDELARQMNATLTRINTTPFACVIKNTVELKNALKMKIIDYPTSKVREDFMRITPHHAFSLFTPTENVFNIRSGIDFKKTLISMIPEKGIIKIVFTKDMHFDPCTPWMQVEVEIAGDKVNKIEAFGAYDFAERDNFQPRKYHFQAETLHESLFKVTCQGDPTFSLVWTARLF